MKIFFPDARPPAVWRTPLPEGNWLVTVVLGGGREETRLTVLSESRRWMLLDARSSPGKTTTRRFVVNVRRPTIPDAEPVRLKLREREPTLHRNWDESLTLEFLGTNVRVVSVSIRRAGRFPTVFLLGDSTVTDQPSEPYAAWGQVLPAFFDDRIAIANHAESGESLRSSLVSGRIEKVLRTLRRGDWVLVQFGHNDQKEKGEGIGPLTSFTADLTNLVEEIRRAGGQPILVTSMFRRHFDAMGLLLDTLGDYPVAVRRVGQVCRVPVLDLHERSRILFQFLGPTISKAAFVHTATIADDTHFSAFGAYRLAKIIAEELRTQAPSLARRLRKTLPEFDPTVFGGARETPRQK